MKSIRLLLLVVVACGLFAAPVMAQEAATPEDIIAKVNEAADFLAQNGEAGLAEFNDSEGPWKFKDTYVFVYNCTDDVIAAHISNRLIGMNISALVDKQDNYLGIDLCAAAESPNGGWTEYYWPKAESEDPERKISYILKVPGQPYEVGAGMYEPAVTLDELNAMIQ